MSETFGCSTTYIIIDTDEHMCLDKDRYPVYMIFHMGCGDPLMG